MFPTQRHVKTGVCCFDTTEARRFRKNQVSFGGAITLPYVGNTFGWQIGYSRDRYNRNHLSLSGTAGKTWIIPVSFSLTANELDGIAPSRNLARAAELPLLWNGPVAQ
jgi:hypothetical protein